MERRGQVDPDAPEASGWTEDVEVDALASARMAVLTEREYGDPERAGQLAARFLEVWPDDEVLARLQQ